MANVLTSLLSKSGQQIRNNFIKKTLQTDVVQEQFLHTLLQDHKKTAFGREYGFGDIKTTEQFQKQIPVLPYSSYEPYTERIAQGEANVLTADTVVHMTLTSGSTGKKKMIPSTRRSQNAFRRASLASIGFLIEALKRRKLEFGKLLLTNSVQKWGRTSGGIDYGSSSAAALRMDKFLYKQLFANPYEALLPENSLARHYVSLLFALRDESTRGMIANFPMLNLRTANYLERYAKELLFDLEKGTIADWLEIEPDVRIQLEQQHAAVPKRAAQLRDILKSEGRLTPKLAWPKLSVIANARGGTSDFYFERFPDYFGDTPIFGAAYSSAEGMFSIYTDVNDDASVLAIESSFFEFIPEDQWEAEHPKTLLAAEVKVGKYYRILITNYSGFYRYDIGDVVEVVGFYETAPLIVFRYRRGGFISSTTEKTTEFHVTQVMQALQQEFSLPLEDFCITLSDNDFPARYLVNIELPSGYTLENPQAFLASFDRKLQDVNTHYQISRRDTIPPPYLQVLASGSFAVIHKRQLQKGIPDSQLKFPHVCENRTLLAGLSVEQEIRLIEDSES